MKEKLEAIFKGPVVFYPLLFAIFPILFLYAYNIREMSADQIMIPLAISVLSTLILWASLSLILRSIVKAGLATTIFALLFFSYGRFYDLLQTWDVFAPKHAYLLPTVLLIFVYCVYFINLARRDFRTTTKVLNVIAVVLIAINLFNIGSYEVGKATSGPTQPASTRQVVDKAIDPEKLKTMPDIYFIILDEYAHPDTMKEWYGYDNSRFIEILEDKGFFVGAQSKALSPCTPEVIASILNMERPVETYYFDKSTGMYITSASKKIKNFKLDVWNENTFKKIGDSKVIEIMKSYGYEYVYIGNWLTIDRWDKYTRGNADIFLNYYETDSTPWVSEFQYSLWNLTMLMPLYPYITGNQYEDYYRRGILNTLAYLKEMPSAASPKFVFAHLMCPHAPYVFSAKGEYISPLNYYNQSDKQFYLGQYVFISEEIEQVLDVLQKKSKTSPIIILQSDHGIRPHNTDIVIGAEEWRKVLNALYLPGMANAVLHDSISPVNTFRLIFNHYFGADYPLLLDD